MQTKDQLSFLFVKYISLLSVLVSPPLPCISYFCVNPLSLDPQIIGQKLF